MAIPLFSPTSSHEVFETLKTVAAFGGFGLGLINLGIGLYKDFWRKGVLTVKIESAVAKVDVGHRVYVQIVLRLEARGGDVFLNKITIDNSRNEMFFTPENPWNIDYFNLYSIMNLVALTEPEAKRELEKRKENCFAVRDFQIKKDSQISMNIIERFTLPDATHSDWSTDGWKLNVCYRNRTLKTPFSFKVYLGNRFDGS